MLYSMCFPCSPTCENKIPQERQQEGRKKKTPKVEKAFKGFGAKVERAQPVVALAAETTA